MSRRYLRDLEDGRRRPRPLTLTHLAEVLAPAEADRVAGELLALAGDSARVDTERSIRRRRRARRRARRAERIRAQRLTAAQRRELEARLAAQALTDQAVRIMTRRRVTLADMERAGALLDQAHALTEGS